MNEEKLNQWDSKLLKARRSGGIVDLRTARQAYLDGVGDEPFIDAALFRMVSSQAIPDSGDLAPDPIDSCNRWLVQGATFPDQIHLADCRRGTGGELPALEFEDCSFLQGFCADDAMIGRLRFSQCRFGTFRNQLGHLVSLSLRNTRLHSDLQIRKLSSLSEDGLLTVSASGLRVEGGIEIADCELCAPPDERTRGEERAQYALNLYGADLRHDLRLFPSVKLKGGITFRGARIGGEAVLSGLAVSDGVKPEWRQRMRQAGLNPRFAIDATSSQIAGNLFFASTPDLNRFTAEGVVDLYGTEVGGSVVLGDAKFDASDSDYALRIVAGHIKGNVIASAENRAGAESRFTVYGNTQFVGLHVQGDMSLDGSVTSLDAGRLTVDGDSYLGVEVKNRLNLGGARLKGQLDLSRFSFPMGEPGVRTNYNVSLKDAEIGHTLYLAFTSKTPLEFMSCHRTKVRCYPGYYIFSIRVDQGTASILWKLGAQPRLLDGVSSYFHELSQSGAVDLSTPEAVRDYVRFFGAYVWGDEGPFAIIESPLQLPEGSITGPSNDQTISFKEMQLDAAFTEDDWRYIEAAVKSGLGGKLPSDEWERYKSHFQEHGVRVQTHVRYGSHLFRTRLVVLTRPLAAKQEDKHRFRRIKQYVRARLQLLQKGRMLPSQPGYIQMLDDEPLGDLNPSLLPVYKRPLIRRPNPRAGEAERLIWDYKSDLPAEPFSQVELTLRIPTWRALLETRLARFQDATVDLTNASCKTLEDADGRAWGPEVSNLRLENFTYDRISTPDTNNISLTPLGRAVLFIHRKQDRIGSVYVRDQSYSLWFRKTLRAATDDRLRWLAHMPKGDFNPQPYAQLAGVLRASGDTDGANTIERRKTDLEVKERLMRLSAHGLLYLPIRAIYRLLWGFLRVGFAYGLSWERATATVAVCLVVGCIATALLNTKGYLVQNTSASATLLATDSRGTPSPAFPRAQSSYDTEDLPCGSSINDLLYATDVFIPLLDLHQESRCDIRAVREEDIDPPREWNAQHSVRRKLSHYLWAIFHAKILWIQLAKSLYAILGWIVISLTILTYSGTLRRWSEK